MNNLAPGAYSVHATYAGFAPFQSPAITLAAGQVKRVDIAMAIEVAQQSVVVTDESPTVSVEAANNANTIIIKGKDLEALSDDPDELSNELSAMASRVGICRPSRRSARFASIRIPTLPSSTGWATGASRF
jgi:hypothetical protein